MYSNPSLTSDGEAKARERRVRTSRVGHVARAEAVAGRATRTHSPATLAATHRATDQHVAQRVAQHEEGQGSHSQRTHIVSTSTSNVQKFNITFQIA